MKVDFQEKGETEVRVLNPSEKHYLKVIRAIGLALLLFLLLINLVGIGVAFLKDWMLRARVRQIAGTVIYQIVYAAGYLLAFMLPVPFLHLFIRKSGYVYHPMRAKPRLSPYLPLILAGGIVTILALANVNASIVSIFRYSEFSAEVLWNASGEIPAWYEVILEFLVMCLVPAFCEEFLFRGAILTNCLPFGRSNAILISALLFGLMHQNAEQILYAFGAGILLGVVYKRTGSIWNCVFLHMINNALSTFESSLTFGFSGIDAQIADILFNGILIAVGMVCVVILVMKFSPRESRFREGFFGRSLPADDSYAQSPVSAKSAVRLFLNLPMVIFLILVAIQILLLILLAVLSNAGIKLY